MIHKTVNGHGYFSFRIDSQDCTDFAESSVFPRNNLLRKHLIARSERQDGGNALDEKPVIYLIENVIKKRFSFRNIHITRQRCLALSLRESPSAIRCGSILNLAEKEIL
jgi:hypothetical protein